MTALERRLREIVAAGRKILSVYITAGHPDPAATPDIACALASAGADVIELGVPFTDPLADGPVIQSAHLRAIGHRVTFGGVLAMAGRIRKSSAVPIIFMGYANTFLSYGFDRAMRDAASAGVDGMIIPDLPLEESGAYREAASSCGLSAILLAAPTTPEDRAMAIAAASTGFIYGVSALGVTGMRSGASAEGPALVDRIRRGAGGRPVLVGFGVSTPADARATAAFADGVIIGSAVVSRLDAAGSAGGPGDAARFVASVREALDRP